MKPSAPWIGRPFARRWLVVAVLVASAGCRRRAGGELVGEALPADAQRIIHEQAKHLHAHDFKAYALLVHPEVRKDIAGGNDDPEEVARATIRLIELWLGPSEKVAFHQQVRILAAFPEGDARWHVLVVPAEADAGAHGAPPSLFTLWRDGPGWKIAVAPFLPPAPGRTKLDTGPFPLPTAPPSMELDEAMVTLRALTQAFERANGAGVAECFHPATADAVRDLIVLARQRGGKWAEWANPLLGDGTRSSKAVLADFYGATLTKHREQSLALVKDEPPPRLAVHPIGAARWADGLVVITREETRWAGTVSSQVLARYMRKVGGRWLWDDSGKIRGNELTFLDGLDSILPQ